jgi:hypothetical protein
MSLPYDEIAATTLDFFAPNIKDNIFKSNALFQRMQKNHYPSYSGGPNIRVPLAFAATSASGWYTGMQTLSVVANDQITAAVYVPKNVYASIVISRTDELANSGKEQVVNFVMAKVQLAEKTIKDNMGTGLFSDGTTNTQSIAGLRNIVGTSSSCGGIDSSSYSWWDAQLDTTTAMSTPLLQYLEGLCTINNDKPTIYVTNQTIYNKVYNQFQPQQRFQDEDVANAGFTSILFNGKPIVVDYHSPSGYFWALNENYLDLYHHKDEDFRLEPFRKPVNQNGSFAQIFWTGAFTTSNRRMNGVLTSIA